MIGSKENRPTCPRPRFYGGPPLILNVHGGTSIFPSDLTALEARWPEWGGLCTVLKIYGYVRVIQERIEGRRNGGNVQGYRSYSQKNSNASTGGARHT